MIRGILQNVGTAAVTVFGSFVLAPAVVAGVQSVGWRAVRMRHELIALLAPATEVFCSLPRPGS